MDPAQRELLVNRVLSGSTRVRVSVRGRERTYLVRRPTREQLYVASELYLEVLRQSQMEGLFTDAELVECLLAQGLWDEPREKALELLPKQIDESKVALYQATFKSNERKVIRKALALAKVELARLTAERNQYAHLTCSGAAGMAKARYLVGVGLHDASGRPVFSAEDFWEDDSPVLDEALSALAEQRIDEPTFRLLARTDPWRTTWNGARVERSLFGAPPADWTDEQRAIVNWSLLYDSVFGHPNCPADAVVEDDDMLDGWLIVQRREREKQLGAKESEVVANEKIRGSQEVYVPAETREDARKVVDMNDDFAKATQKARFAKLASKGTVNELEMPDTAQRLRMEATQKLSQAMNGAR